VNIIHHWSLDERNEYISGCSLKQNPVTKKLCRSGECMCGTMQSDEDRIEASYHYPDWGKWIDELEAEVIKKFPWKWGREITKGLVMESKGQMNMFNNFMPMCVSCKADYKDQKANA